MPNPPVRIPVSHFYFQQDTCWVLESESLRLGGTDSPIEQIKDRNHPLASDCGHLLHGVRWPVWLGRGGQGSRIWRSNPAAPNHSFDLELAHCFDDRGALK